MTAPAVSALLPGPPVDALAQQVDVADVAGVLLHGWTSDVAHPISSCTRTIRSQSVSWSIQASVPIRCHDAQASSTTAGSATAPLKSVAVLLGAVEKRQVHLARSTRRFQLVLDLREVPHQAEETTSTAAPTDRPAARRRPLALHLERPGSCAGRPGRSRAPRVGE